MFSTWIISHCHAVFYRVYMENSGNLSSKSVYITLLLDTRLASYLTSIYQWYFPAAFTYLPYFFHVPFTSVIFFLLPFSVQCSSVFLRNTLLKRRVIWKLVLVLETHGYTYENIYIFIKRARVCLFLEVGSWSLLVQVECRSQQSVSDCQSCNCRFLHVGFPLVSEIGLVNPLFPCCIQGGQTCDCENTAVSLWLVVEQRGQSCQNILSGMLSCSWLRFWDLLVAIYAKI